MVFRLFRASVLMAAMITACAAQQTQVLSASANYPPANSGMTIRRTVDEVHLTFTVHDKHNRPVLGLRPEQVSLKDDEHPVGNLLGFRADEQMPLRLAVVVDASDSIGKHFFDEQRVATEFLERLMRPQTDRGLIVAFRGSARLVQPATADIHRLENAVNAVRQGGVTAVYDAVVDTADDLTQREATLVRRVLVLISDGNDNNSHYGFNDMIASVQRSDVSVYAISVHGRLHVNDGDRVLQKLADASGGRMYRVARAGDLEGAFAEIEQELRSQYAVAFRPVERDGQFHSLQVNISGAGGVRIRARNGYWAPRESRP